VDVGGTFTDFCAVDEETGKALLWKHPSTPENPAVAVVEGLREMSAALRIPLGEVTRLAHGTTVATNALIQRRGCAVALVTTRGFRDLVEIGRQVRPHLYDLQRDQPEPLVPRQRRLEVTERIDSTGAIHRPLALCELDDAIERIRTMDVDAVAVCFLFAFLNPVHEQAAAERIRAALPGVHVSTSAAVQPEFREYERFTTTIVNAYLQPVFSRYMSALESDLAPLLPRASIGINQSSGGLMTVARARSYPVRTALSGPAAGVVGALHVAAAVGRRNAITIDVGGTSADVAVIRDGEVSVAYGREVDGFPIRLPMVDIQTIGAGGGSIAWFDRDGLLKVGPQSAGARPGPACYGLGGTAATLSDANLVLGRLAPSLLDGAMPLDLGCARAAIDVVASPMGKSIEETARGMVAIAVANMVRAIRALSVERGHDPRDFVLMPFGGAGPMHARDIAVAMSMREIVVPRSPGIVCAQGLVLADVKEDFSGAARTVVDEVATPALANVVRTLGARALKWAADEALAPGALRYDLSFDMRYVGQSFELAVPISSGPELDPDALPDAAHLKRLFFAAHDLAYSYHDPHAKVELLNVRLTVRASIVHAADEPPPGASAGASMPVGERAVHFDENRAVLAPVYRRDALPVGTALTGPAVIDQIDSTIPLFPGDRLTVHASGNLLIELRP